VSLDNVGQVARDLGRPEEAREAFQESLALLRQLRAALGDTPQVLRDLSVSLDNVGEVARDLGRLEEARESYQESLALLRQLRAALGDTP
jgi:tetratricopeptide (TPR) repeat protein